MNRSTTSLLGPRLLITAALVMIGASIVLVSVPSTALAQQQPAIPFSRCNGNGLNPGCENCNVPFPPQFGCTAGVPQHWQLGGCQMAVAGQCIRWINYNCGVGIECGSSNQSANMCLQSTVMCK